MRGRKEKPLESVQGTTTLIAPQTVITGDIHFSGNLDIEGRVVGSIVADPDAEAMLRVIAGGSVEGEIRAPAAVINGKVAGDIHASQRLELADEAEVDGDVYYNLIEMAVGCKLNGGMRHVSPVSDDLARKREAREQDREVGQ
ncbi:integral membrane protein CcmA involved in cell shape determination [Luminiphilus syltensis NOR5-1B]|uniref:Integral membrane protein CcmA involved in cell shape determination n=1 Tax=Luminiphilus syltensis NOR5-1B TaxID=565045 RepID=B8KW20_9GAMM|nr:polymer-forming cytoskeletal protein [Luminiphilus syltensis]EED36366.1 integral membrane protein CcmA involved in cell shape determination [Luminiphilus syltensis NOR5-1B]